MNDKQDDSSFVNPYFAKVVKDNPELMNYVRRRVKVWRAKRIAQTGELRKVLEPFDILFAYESDYIEYSDYVSELGTNLDRDLYAMLFRNTHDPKIMTYDPNEILYASNQYAANEYLYACFAEAQEVTLGLVFTLFIKLSLGQLSFTTKKNTIDVSRDAVDTRCFRENIIIDKSETSEGGLVDPMNALEQIIDACNAYDIFDDETDPLELFYNIAEIYCLLSYLSLFNTCNGLLNRSLAKYLFVIEDLPPVLFRFEDKITHDRALQNYIDSRINDPENTKEYGGDASSMFLYFCNSILHSYSNVDRCSLDEQLKLKRISMGAYDKKH